MSTVIERKRIEPTKQHLPTNGLFQVWIDLGCGIRTCDWWWNSPPQPLREALAEANEARAARAGGWICKVMPEGQNPRPDGRWDNP